MARIAKRSLKNGFIYVMDFFDQDGKRQRIQLPKGTLKKDADKALDEIKSKLRTGAYIPAKEMPLFSEVAQRWLAHKKTKIRATTWAMYEGHTRNHFSELNGMKIDRITIATIETWIAERERVSMNVVTIRKMLVCLNQIMQYAVRHRYITINPVRDAERPRSTGHKKAIRILSPGQIQAFLGCVTNRKYKLLFKLAVLSGMRQGEILGLQWNDIDYTNSQIRVRRSFNHGALYDTKTAKSRRNIDIGCDMMKGLKKWKLRSAPNELDLVFPNDAGKHNHHSNMVRRHFKPALKKAGVDEIRFHDLRHTYASLKIDQGENIVYISEQLGHATPTITLNVYSHLLNKVNTESANKFEKALFG